MFSVWCLVNHGTDVACGTAACDFTDVSLWMSYTMMVGQVTQCYDKSAKLPISHKPSSKCCFK